MRRNQFGWLLLIGSAALQAGACAETERNERDAGSAGSGTGGKGNGGSKNMGGSKNTAGAPASGGSTSNGGEPALEVGGQGGQGTSGEPSGDAGAGGALEPPTCGERVPLGILGDYREPSGDDLWLRDSGKAVTLARVPAGTPVAGRLPALWEVVQACPAELVLVLKNGSASFTRLDYLPGKTSLTACFTSGSASTIEAARALPAADRANTIDAGCDGKPWLRVTKGGS